jgi:hypothetical protein
VTGAVPDDMQHNAMRPAPILLVATIVLATPGLGRAGEAAPRGPVVVELFTSQGCSSCPPADAYLGRLAKESGILALGFHIDYWNYIGWADPYSLKLAAQRQRAYATRLGPGYVFTPEMVIDGQREGVGSEPDKIEPLLRAAERAAPGPALSLERRPGGGFHLHVGAGKTSSPATLWLVGFDRRHKTDVLRGENEGRIATDYQVVRSFKAVGVWRGQALDLDLPAGAAVGDAAALLLQANGTGPILTAAKLAGPAS